MGDKELTIFAVFVMSLGVISGIITSWIVDIEQEISMLIVFVLIVITILAYRIYVIKKARNLPQNNDGGVSPVIAVILMVAITVILAATIYVWVSQFGTSNSNVYSSQFNIIEHSDPLTSGDDNLFTILHKGGDTLNFENFRIRICVNNICSENVTQPSGIFTVGDSFVVAEDGENFEGFVKIQMIDDSNSRVFYENSLLLS